MQTNIRQRFEEKFPFKEERVSGFTYITVPPKPSELLSFFQQELLALAEEAEHAQANGEAVSELIRSKAESLL